MILLDAAPTSACATRRAIASTAPLIEEMNVIPDFRDPDNIRLGFAPLYISFTDIWEGFDRIRKVVEEKRYEHYPKQRLTVT